MAQCSGCGEVNQPGKKFCRECGSPLALRCKACGSAVQPDQRFCDECGAPLSAPAPSTPGLSTPGLSAPVVAERRVCSVVFVDLVGFTPLSEGRDAEEVRELLSRYFGVARTIIGRYGGVVEKFIGDAVMAVWGAPLADEGDTERAVRAALDLVEAVGVLGGEVGAPGLAARAGVVTGEVAVTLGATGEGMVAGDAVNTASRVQAAAGAGTVLVDSATRRLTAASIGFIAAGEHLLKGKTAPEELWRATRVLSGVGGSQRSDGLEAPLLGRDTELRTIKDLFHASAERRAPRLVVVSGAAGVGKSRLGWEFEKYIDGLADTVLWHRGRCLSYGEGVAFWALAEIIRQRFGIAEEDPLDVAAAKLAEGITRFVPDLAERTYVAVRLGRLLAIPVAADPGGTLLREELFAGWRLFFERLAEVAPVALVVEDAQHADPGLLDFLEHLIDWSRGAPIFVAVLARPELAESRTGFGSGRYRTAIWLDPLDTTSMDRLVAELAPGLSSAAYTTIAGQAQGNPLFAVETIRSLIDRRIVAADGDRHYRLVGQIDDLTVPEGLRALLAARLDALEPEVRRLAADAAVLGSTFPAEALAAIARRSEEEIRSGLDELVRREVLEIRADPLSPQRGTYRFGQDMLRQVAYDTLSRRDRKARHLAVAAHLRATFAADGEEVTDVIARHYLDALNAVPDDPDIDTIRTDAIDALVRAGERAETTGAPTRAAHNYTTAARLEEDTHEHQTAAELWERAAKVDVDLNAAAVANGRAQELYLREGRLRDAARAQRRLGEALRTSGRHREARPHLAAAVAVLRHEPDADTVRALAEIATLEMFDGGGDVEPLLAEALTLAEAMDLDRAALALLFDTVGTAHYFNNRPEQAIAYLQRSAHLAEQVGDGRALGLALINLSGALVTTDPGEAVLAATAAADRFRRLGRGQELAWAVQNLQTGLLLSGEWSRADQESGPVAQADGIYDLDSIAVNRAWLAAMRGQTTEATEMLAGLSGIAATEDIQDLAVLEVVRALIDVALDRPADALGHARTALAHAEHMSVRHEALVFAWPIAADAAHALDDRDATSELLAQLDRHPVGHLPPLLRAEGALARARRLADQNHPDAPGALVEAVAAVRRTGSPYHLAHALLDQATFLIDHGDPTAASAAIDEVGAMAVTLDAPGLARRAAQVGGRRVEPVA